MLTWDGPKRLQNLKERDLDFAQYRTYSWGPADALPVGDPRLDKNSHFRDFLEGVVEKRMAAKGYQATADRPDLLIHYHAAVTTRINVNDVDRSYGYCEGGHCEPQVSEYEQGTLVIDIVDTKTNRVIWRGWSQHAMTGVIEHEDRLEQQVGDGVAKLLENLPRVGAPAR